MRYANERISETIQTLEKAIQASSIGDEVVANAYEESAEYGFQSATAYAVIKKQEANNLRVARLNAEKVAEVLQQAAHARGEENEDLARGYEESAEYGRKVVKAYVEGDRVAGVQAIKAWRDFETSTKNDKGLFVPIDAIEER